MEIRDGAGRHSEGVQGRGKGDPEAKAKVSEIQHPPDNARALAR